MVFRQLQMYVQSTHQMVIKSTFIYASPSSDATDFRSSSIHFSSSKMLHIHLIKYNLVHYFHRLELFSSKMLRSFLYFSMSLCSLPHLEHHLYHEEKAIKIANAAKASSFECIVYVLVYLHSKFYYPLHFEFPPLISLCTLCTLYYLSTMAHFKK